MINGFDAISGAAFGGGGGGGGGAILPPSIRHTQFTNPHVPIRPEYVAPTGVATNYGIANTAATVAGVVTAVYAPAKVVKVIATGVSIISENLRD